MNTEFELDMSSILRMPQMDVAGSLALVASIVAAAPEKVAEGVARALAALTKSGATLDKAWRAQQFTATPREDPRPFDVAMDRAWGAMVGRLEPYASLPDDRTDVAQAKQVLAIMAPDGLAILKMPFRVQWSHINSRLTELKAQRLEGTLRSLAGDVFVDEVNERFADYGRVLCVTEAAASASNAGNLNELRRAVGQRVTEYTIQVLATVDEERPATMKAARAALRPIHEARATASARRASTDAADTDPAPTPAPEPAAPRNPVVAPQRPSAAPPVH